MQHAFVHVETVPCPVMLSANVTRESLCGDMRLYVVPNVLPDLAGPATHHALKLSVSSLAHQLVDPRVQELQLVVFTCKQATFLTLENII